MRYAVNFERRREALLAELPEPRKSLTQAVDSRSTKASQRLGCIEFVPLFHSDLEICFGQSDVISGILGQKRSGLDAQR